MMFKISGTALGMLVLTGMGFAVESAVAEDCSPRQNPDMGDDYYMCDAGWQCQQLYIDYWWPAFGFDSTWSSFGYDDACNNARPLARTFNALFALGYASTNSPSCNRSLMNTSLWAMCYAAEEINTLKAATGNVDSPLAKTTGNTVTLYSYFWGKAVSQRASTIFHEGRHAEGCLHNASDGSCDRHESCDKSWSNGCPAPGNDDGANRYQISYLSWYAQTATRITPALRQAAVDRANVVIDTGYRDIPCFDINSAGQSVGNGCNN